MAEQKILNLSKLKDEDLIKLAVHVLRELDNRVSSSLHYLDMYKNCSIEKTWVKNKVGRIYYYYYLKCRDGHPKSIYLHNKPLLRQKILKIKSIRSELRIALRIHKLINELRIWIDHISDILSLTRSIEEATRK